MLTKIKKLLLIFVVFGIVCGVVIGFLLGTMILSLYYNFAAVIFFSLLTLPFFILGFWKRIRSKDWVILIRSCITVFLISCFLSAMISLEEGAISFSTFDWAVISICIAFTTILFTLLAVIAEFYSSSRLYKELFHLYNGMKIFGLIPDFEEKDKNA